MTYEYDKPAPTNPAAEAAVMAATLKGYRFAEATVGSVDSTGTKVVL